MKVKVYKNLTKDTWSIQDYKTRKVIGYSENIRLENAQFVVSEKTRQRVIKEGSAVLGEFDAPFSNYTTCESSAEA